MKNKKLKKMGTAKRSFSIALLVLFLVSVGAGAWLQSQPVQIIIKSQGIALLDSGMQTIKSPKAGIVRNIYIKDGEYVGAGEVVYSLAKSADVWKVQQYRTELKTLEYRLKRLRALERKGKFVSQKSRDKELQKIIQAEKKAYNRSMNAHYQETRALNKDLNKTKLTLKALRLRYESVLRRYKIAENKRDKVKALFAQGVATKVEVIDIEKQLREMQNERNRLIAEIRKYTKRVEKVKNTKKMKENNRKALLSDEISKVLSRIKVVKAGISSITKSGKVVQVRSPIAGNFYATARLRPGKTISTNTTAFTVQTKEPELKVKVYAIQRNVPYLIHGQQALVTGSDGRKYKGIVDSVDYENKKRDNGETLYPFYVKVYNIDAFAEDNAVLPVKIIVGQGRNPETIFSMFFSFL